jgi:S-adenosylmethionine hydrolase
VAGPFVSFLSDFGTDTAAAATCRGVIWSIAPDARLCDLTHSVRKFAVRDGAFLLWCSVAYLPVGVHLAVVDPGVGTSRRPIAVRAPRGDLLVGPDNGLLMPAADRLGGVVEARHLTNSTLWRAAVSATFHGRDVLAPVAAHLATGVDLSEVGPSVAPASLVPLDFPPPAAREGGLDTSVLFIDSFGNARLGGTAPDLTAVAGGALPAGRALRIGIGGRTVPAAWATTFGEVAPGTLLLYEDADFDGLALAVNQGSAAAALDLTLDAAIRIELG